MKYFLIYKITNNLNGKIYIGQHQTENVDDGYMGSGMVIKQAVAKYGADNFTKEILYFCTDWDTMNSMEEVIVDEAFVKRKDTYNMKTGGRQGILSEESRRKSSEAHKGKPLSEEHKRKLLESRKGKPLPEETKRKISEAHKGKRASEETKRKLSEAHKGRSSPNKGKLMTEEQKRRISETLKGKKRKPLSEETKRKISEAHKGKPKSEETKRKISEALMGKPRKQQEYKQC
jgi:group I intron endonuclease